MHPEEVAALIALAGVILSVGLSFLVSMLTRKFNYHHLYAEVVSQSRNQWLNEMRQYISLMLAEAMKCQNTYKSKEYYKARNEVILRLNIKEPLHLMLENSILRLDNCTSQNFFAIERNIVEVSRRLLKIEWDRVRKEAKGGK